MDHTEDKKPRRRYRLNGKKLATTLFLLVFAAAVIVVAILALKDASAGKAIGLEANVGNAVGAPESLPVQSGQI